MERMKLDPATLRVESFATPQAPAPDEAIPTTTVLTNHFTCTCEMAAR